MSKVNKKVKKVFGADLLAPYQENYPAHNQKLDKKLIKLAKKLKKIKKLFRKHGVDV